MSIAALQNVHWDYAGRLVLDGLEWHIQRGEKVGLVGPNGAGKTTLFRLILGELVPPIGTVTRARGLDIGYLPQEPALDSARSLLEEVSRGFEHLRRVEERLAEVGQAIADQHESGGSDELLEEYDELHARLEAAGGFHYDVVVKEVLGGLGFSPADYGTPIAALSGGQKCRAALARVLLEEPDLLLLDEPTNHLDIEATRFLEKFLAGYHGAAVIVSHDRWLLDRVVDKIADLENYRVTLYPGGYSDYAEANRVRELTAEREFEKQQAWLAHQRDFIVRNLAAKDTARRAHAREKAIERLSESGSLLKRPAAVRRRIALTFAPPGRTADRLLSCEGVAKAYREKVLLAGLNLEVRRGEKIGIIGPNGVGKTTLLKLVLGLVEPDAGQIWRPQSLQIGYYDQEHAALDPAARVIDLIDPQASGPREAEIRSYLARFLFRGGEVYKPIAELSGGEQSRVSLARLVWSAPQMLILDEPTNHLDIPAKEVLEEALIDFEGATLLVSHDRYFLDRVVNRLLVLKAGGEYELLVGNWSTYEELLSAREAEQRAAAEAARPQRTRRGRTPGVRARTGTDHDSPYAAWSTDRLEQEIIEREEQLSTAEAQFADPAVYRDPDRARALRAESEALRAELAALNAEWESREE